MKKYLLSFSIMFFMLFIVACGNRSVTVSFDAQGGTAVDAITITQLTEITEPVSVREGYSFKGWYEESAFETLFDFNEGATRNITLYAKWEINQYTLSFETNNGTSVADITANYQATIALPTNLNKEGYTFGGWYSDDTFTTPFQATRMVANDLTLYAKWNPIYYTVEFYSGNDLVSTQSIQHGSTIEQLPNIPQREGFNASWDYDGSEVFEDTRIDALYEIKVYTVTFIDQWDHVYFTFEVNHGDVVPEITANPEKLGYTFAGYSEDLSEFVITEDTEIEVFFTPISFIVNFRVQGSQVKSETVLYGQSATAPTVNVPGYTFISWDKSFDEVTANLEVNAILTPNDYDIVLYGNGGMFGEEETFIITQAYQSSVTHTGVPSREGYQFAGWYLNAEGTGSPISLTNYSMPLDGISLYAKWEVINYSITYHDLFGTQNGNPTTYKVTDSIILSNPTSRIGYTFIGWFLPSEEEIQVTEIILGTTGNLDLYARWEANEYTISFDTDGGEAITPVTVTYDDSFILPTPTKTGYTFIEWQLEGLAFDSGIWNMTNDITLVAIYEANEYTITFDTAGGNLMIPMVVTFDESFVLPSATKAGYTFIEWQLGGVGFGSGTWTLTNDVTLVATYNINTYTITYSNLNGTTHSNPTNYTVETPSIILQDPTSRTGYTFIGWFTQSTGGTEVTEITIGSVGNRTLFARWQANEYTITFDSNGGSAIIPMTVTYGQSFVLPEPIQDGFNFAGWTYNSEAFGSGTYNIASDITLVAVWTEWPVIEFDSNGGTYVESISEAPGDAISEPLAPTRAGYTFIGWYLDDDTFLNEYTFTVMPSEDLILYAKWQANEYTITFDTNGGDALFPMLVAYDDSFVLPTPTRTGYTFIEWQLGGEGFVSGTWNLTNDITLVAIYEADEYTITYNNLEGTTQSNPLSYTIETATINLLSPTSRTGYTFAGWFTDLVGGTQVTSIPLGSTGDMILYAHWTPIVYTITFDIDGVETYVYVPYMETINPLDIPEIPTKANYDLTTPYWDNDPTTHVVTGNYTFTAVYVPNPMTVTYNTGEGTSINPDTVPYGFTLTAPTAPTRNGYTFLAWYIDIELSTLYDFNNPVTSDMTLYAAWSLDFYTWEIESIFLKEDLDDPNIVIVDPLQPSITTTFINLYYGLERNPVQIYEGYEFDYFVYDGVQYSDIEQLIMVTGDRVGAEKIQVFYRKIILTITFAQDPDLFTAPDEPIVTFRIYYNDTFLLENAPTLIQPSGELAIWDRTQFENMKVSIVVYAIYYDTTVKTVTFFDRGIIKFIASAFDDIGNPILQVIGADSILWDLYRPGYKFLGWFDAETGGNQIIQGDLLFSQFPDVMTNLYAQWLELTSFTTPTNIDITADETQIVISWDINPATINGFQPAGYEFVLNNQLITGLTTVPTLSANTFTLTLLSTNPEYALFQELVNPGTHNLSIRALGDEDNHYHSETSEVFVFVNESIFSGDPTEVAVYDYFIIETYEETKRYIFYTNLDYQFGSTYTFEIVTGQEIATASANTISTNGISGSFKFRMIREGYPTVVYDALVVHDIKQFDIGSNYQNYLDATGAGSAFLDQAVDYYVGYGNEFYLDLRMVNNQGSRIPLAQTYLDYQLYELVGETYQLISEANISNYLSFVGDNQIQLQASTVGKTLKLVVEPRYQANAMTVTPLEYIFTVNDGVNVFNNQQLKQYFGDFNVSTINIHASFKAELSTSQLNSDGSPINRRPTLANPVTGNAYQRFSTSIDDDNFTIEGNFMTIDGSDLPFSNADSGSGTVGFAESFEIISVQIGVFFYGVTDTSLTNNLNNNQFTMNNLIVKGNTSTPYVDFSGTAEEIEIQERLMSKNSGGYTGVMVASGSSNLNNLVIFNTVIAVTNNAFGYKTDTMPTYITMDYVKVYNSWANSLYAHGGQGFLIYNSEILQSGGAAIHMVDTKPAIFDESYNKIGDPNPYLYLDSSTIINNWISGEEAWFKAYGMSQVALTLKSGIETGISGAERSIINLMTDPITGLETEKINFILLTEPSAGAKVMLPPNNVTQISGSEFKVHIGDYTVERPFDYLTSGDPRISNNQFAFPLGDYSEYSAFQALIVELMTTYGMDAGNAQNLAQLAAFYGLTAGEVVSAYTYAQMNAVSFRTAVLTTMPTHELPEYMEVLAPVPVFTSGYSIVIIQFSE